jgi:hypothetical protein
MTLGKRSRLADGYGAGYVPGVPRTPAVLYSQALASLCPRPISDGSVEEYEGGRLGALIGFRGGRSGETGPAKQKWYPRPNGLGFGRRDSSSVS